MGAAGQRAVRRGRGAQAAARGRDAGLEAGLSRPVVTFEPAVAADAQALVAIRIAAMRESLERLGRFDPKRARDRFLSAFDPALTRHVLADGERVGFVVVRTRGDGLLLDHLYLLPRAQGRGIGAAVLDDVLARADASRLPVRVGALRGSGANRFYARHGFELIEEGEFDNHYLRAAVDAARRDQSQL